MSETLRAGGGFGREIAEFLSSAVRSSDDAALGQRRTGGVRSQAARESEDRRITDPKWTRQTGIAASGAVVVISGLVILGWILDIDALKMLLTGFSMKAIAALAFMFAGIASLSCFVRTDDPAMSGLRRVLALIVGLIGAATLVEVAFGWDLRIDEFLTGESTDPTPFGHPGRMSPIAAASFLLFAAAIFFVDLTRRPLFRRAFLLAMVVGNVPSLVAIIGYAYDAPALYGFGHTIAIALHAAICFLLLFLAVAMARPNLGWLALARSRGAGGALARLLFPSVTVVPVVLGGLRLAGEEAGWYDGRVGLTLFAASNVLVLFGAVWFVARRLDIVDLARQRSRQELAERESQLLRAQRIARLGNWIWRPLANGDWREGRVDFSPTATEILGIVPSAAPESGPEYIGRFVVAEDRDRVSRHFEQFFAPQSSLTSFEYRIRRSDGAIRIVREIASTSRTESGDILHIFGTMQDITELREVENALTQSRKLVERQAVELRALYGNAPVGLAAVDRKLRFVVANDYLAKMDGFEPSQMVGRTVAEVVPHIAPLVERHYRTVLESGQPVVGVEFRGETGAAPGTVRDFTTSYYPRVSPDGEIIGVNLVVQEMTEKRQIEAQLRQSQKMESIGQLTGGIAHDFNNLLTVIVGYTDLLADARGLSSAARHQVKMIEQAAQNASELTRGLLAFGRRQTLRPRSVDVNQLVRKLEPILRRTIGETIEVDCFLAEEVAPCFADPAQIESAILNLSVNARDAMPQGGRITLETREERLEAVDTGHDPDVRPGDYVCIAVGDTGMGIAPENIAKVMEPFFTTKEVGRGTGLGLSMVYGFAKQSGGHVRIFSELGLGTVVRLYLPRSPMENRMHQAERTDAPAVAGGSETILVVEDDAMVRDYIVAQLRLLGYGVVEAPDGPAGLATLDTHRNVDLIISDMVMPKGMSGIDLAKAAWERYPGLKVLLTSGYNDSAFFHPEEEGIELLTKPFGKDTLARKIRAVLDRT